VFGAALANPTTLLAASAHHQRIQRHGRSGGGRRQQPGSHFNRHHAVCAEYRANLYSSAARQRGRSARAIPDGGWQWGSTLGNLTLTTFDITNPRSPAVLANIVLPYTSFREGPAVQIGPNLSLFAGAQDNSGNNLLLLVDTTNPLSPVVTPTQCLPLCRIWPLSATCCTSPPVPPVMPSTKSLASPTLSTNSPETVTAFQLVSRPRRSGYASRARPVLRARHRHVYPARRHHRNQPDGFYPDRNLRGESVIADTHSQSFRARSLYRWRQRHVHPRP